MTMVKNAGTASVKSSKRIYTISPIINAPIRIRAGAVAWVGMNPTSGANASAMRNRIPTTTAVSPVRPPSAHARRTLDVARDGTGAHQCAKHGPDGICYERPADQRQLAAVVEQLRLGRPANQCADVVEEVGERDR